ncbi:MAG: hypothetical protein K2X76_06800 [Sphingomonas sp.]|nr:hypothetical protein [Sphingomonas sp.]
MGFKISWLAVRGVDPAAMLDRLGLIDTGVLDEVNESPFSVAALPGGWVILWANDFEYADDRRALTLSVLGETIAVQLHEGVMYAEARGYGQGERRWSIVYDPDVDDVSRTGTPPAQMAAIEAACRARQAAEDENVSHLFDVPLEVAASLCGFSHDAGLVEGGDLEFTEARPR